MAIEGPSKAEIVCKDNENGSCDVTYNPMIPGDYSIIIKFADQNIPGSPFIAKIIGNCTLSFFNKSLIYIINLSIFY